ncbi:MAG: helix-turn-helix transcriptional regulator [Sphingomonadales bacterium]|nr:helix-turn-helix transcriptional regulator [Sphingomonadales bacterium]
MRRRRKELRITQQKLAAILGISYQQVQKYGTGANRISAGRLYHIAKVLGVDPNFFFAGLMESDENGTWSPTDSKWEMNPRVRDALANLVDALKT